MPGSAGVKKEFLLDSVVEPAENARRKILVTVAHPQYLEVFPRASTIPSGGTLDYRPKMWYYQRVKQLARWESARGRLRFF